MSDQKNRHLRHGKGQGPSPFMQTYLFFVYSFPLRLILLPTKPHVCTLIIAKLSQAADAIIAKYIGCIAQKMVTEFLLPFFTRRQICILLQMIFILKVSVTGFTVNLAFDLFQGWISKITFLEIFHLEMKPFE